ncbi:MAG: SUMF1/EgtB/PvdO family nonheme iron enzyme [Treponema sp.]|jgi:hypothetical protein|nr:SUMF1/EgtB/PvdO family nonheme iron enzyme [Treponema sp.]
MINKKKTKKTAAGNGKDANDCAQAQGPNAILPEDRVVLPSVLGLRPGVYLAVIYCLVIIAAVFAALIYPGLSNPGSAVVLRSEPHGAAVRVDGIYLGTAPCEIFVSQGKRTFEFVLPGFTPVTAEYEIPGRVFASAFAPKRVPVTAVMTAADPLEALVLGAADFAAWSLAGEPTAAYQIPLSLSEGAYRAGPAAADPIIREDMTAILDAALRFTATRAALRDFLRAAFLIDNGGLSPSPVSALGSARDLIARLEKSPGAAEVLANYLSPDAASAVKNSAWYRKSPPASQTPDTRAFSSRTIEAGGLVFRESSGGFYIAAEAVPSSSWEAFLAANPRWKLQNAAALREQGLVTDEYLAAFAGGPPDTGISCISWYAAKAYCEWLTGLLPPDLSSYNVRLPTEAEWEYAPPVQGESFSFWEWCEDLYAPLGFLPAQEEAAARIGSPERSLRGGSWINQPGSVNTETRASLPPQFCSPFVSFRPLIAPRPGPGHE